MTQKRGLIPFMGLLLWCSVIMIFDRHDMAFYAASFLFALFLTFLSLAQTAPKFIEIKVETDEDY